MRKVLILVEGQTEEAFVKRLLAAHLELSGVIAIPVILATRRLLTGAKERGGYVPYARLRSELLRLLQDTSATRVTTMLDYYGLPPAFPGRDTPQGRSNLERVEHVEAAWAADLAHPRFLPYLALHEFEGMLFADPDAIADVFGRSDRRVELHKIRREFATPEDINDGENSAPSRRLEKLFPNYNKPFYGARIAERIGLSGIRSQCVHFDSWIRRLEEPTVGETGS